MMATSERSIDSKMLSHFSDGWQPFEFKYSKKVTSFNCNLLVWVFHWVDVSNFFTGPMETKEKPLQEIYEYMTQYFEPKPRQRGGSQADSAESQELDGEAESPGTGESVGSGAEIEEAPPVHLFDPYSVDPFNGDNLAVVEREQERLCWTLGGEMRKTPTPRDDFEAFASPEPPKLELAEEGKAFTKEVMQSVQERIEFLEKLS